MQSTFPPAPALAWPAHVAGCRVHAKDLDLKEGTGIAVLLCAVSRTAEVARGFDLSADAGYPSSPPTAWVLSGGEHLPSDLFKVGGGTGGAAAAVRFLLCVFSE